MKALFKHFRVRSPGDFLGALAGLTLALVAWINLSGLDVLGGSHFGAATAPRVFATLVIAMAILIIVLSMIFAGPRLERPQLRGMFFIVAALLVFAFTVRSFGLLIAGFLAVTISSFATTGARPLEALMSGIVLSVSSAVLFGYLLGLSIPIWPEWL